MSTTIKPTESGTAFLTTSVSESADKIFTLEQRDEEQRWIEESAATFIQREVLPLTEAIDHQEPGVLPTLVKKAGEQGLLMIDVPEEYGGAELGLLTSSLVGSELREASFSVAFGAHTTIGTLPIVFYGTEAYYAGPASRLSLRRYMSFSLRRNRATRPARSMGQWGAAAAHSAECCLLPDTRRVGSLGNLGRLLSSCYTPAAGRDPRGACGRPAPPTRLTP